MLSMPFDGTIGTLSSAAGWCFGGWVSGCRPTPFGATEASGGNAPSGHVGTCGDPTGVAADADAEVGAPADVSDPGDPVVHATAITPSNVTAVTDRISPRGA